MKSSTLIIKGLEIQTLLAVSDDEQRKGLMHCNDLPPSMSFIYKTPKINKFWMHNTPKKLDIVFCKNGKVSYISKGEPFSTSLIGPDYETDLVVEFPYGTCKKLNITEGDSVNLPEVESPTLFTKEYY